MYLNAKNKRLRHDCRSLFSCTILLFRRGGEASFVRMHQCHRHEEVLARVKYILRLFQLPFGLNVENSCFSRFDPVSETSDCAPFMPRIVFKRHWIADAERHAVGFFMSGGRVVGQKRSATFITPDYFSNHRASKVGIFQNYIRTLRYISQTNSSL